MSGGPRSPERWWFRAAVAASFIVAALSGWWIYNRQVSLRSVEALSPSAREELAALTVPARKTAALEREWVSDGFRSESLVAPVGPMPCEPVASLVRPSEQIAVREALLASQQADPDVRIEQLAAINDGNPGNLLVVQMLGTSLIDAGLYPDAEQVIAEGLGGTNEDEDIIKAARTSTTLDLDDVRVSTVIHLHHALGVARLSQSSAEPPWISLKNVIGSVKPLSKRRLMGPTRGRPVWSRLLIAAPGCTGSESGRPQLSSYDLFNNLIVGYMKGKFTGGESERAKEFARPQKNYPSGLHRLLLAQVARGRANGWQNEAQLWALSNVEQVIDWQMPDDARLAYNAVQLIDWWTDGVRCPANVCTEELLADVRSVRDRLVEQAFKRRNVAQEQRAVFARGLVGMLASSTVDRSKLADAAKRVGEWLPPAERGTLDDLIAADRARVAMPRWIFAPATDEEPSEPPHAKLGPRAGRWHAAALTDVAAVAAKWAAGRPPKEQRSALVAIRQLLGSSEAPPELTALEQQRSWSDRMRMRLTASNWLWAVIAVFLAVLIWLILVWILVHIRERRMLRVSLYNVELEHLAAIEQEHR